MHNFGKLSPVSQSFISRLTGGSSLNIAAAKAVANKLPLPSFEVGSVQDHYNSTVYDEARSLVSKLNEVVAINARDTLALVESFWKTRYHTVFPPKNLLPCASGCISSFMGFGTLLPQGVVEDIRCGGDGLVRTLNGFTFVLGDLTATDLDKAQQENPNMTELVAQPIVKVPVSVA